MLNSIVVKTLKASVITVALLGTSLTAQADTSLLSGVAQKLEHSISEQVQGMLAKAQTELSLSIQSQVSEMVFEFDESDAINTNTKVLTADKAKLSINQ
ncbi:hypothetical protein [Shewanella youngdeokensis]|uniref:Uncharacterized protein n=1 Tax=Shewanella youngdeokensis TaxID=2999068 RepID=A0ABZ0JYH1_9GAMM|nr:hypothetical protein RGE70_15230 [Shewanella sp. DAU334]